MKIKESELSKIPIYHLMVATYQDGTECKKSDERETNSIMQTRGLRVSFSENILSPDKRIRRQPVPKSLRTKIYSKAPKTI